jgi:hypothetical protein
METWNALQISCISTQQMSSIYIKHGICNSKKMIWKEFRGMNLCMKYGSMFCFVFLIEFPKPRCFMPHSWYLWKALNK